MGAGTVTEETEKVVCVFPHGADFWANCEMSADEREAIADYFDMTVRFLEGRERFFVIEQWADIGDGKIKRYATYLNRRGKPVD